MCLTCHNGIHTLNKMCCAGPMAQSWPTLRPHGLQPIGSSVHWRSPGRNTRVSCHALSQGILPTEGLNPGLPHCRWVLYHLRHHRSPRILEWVACSFSRGSSQPRNWTGVSCIAGEFFTSWATREAQLNKINNNSCSIFVKWISIC